ncbi:hypothetical protein SOVF_111480 [Spinacia oleracea]|uniref:Uncharacterized protein LOC110782076 n=1 Tax=Spinacia oleracea TaxID=3562 RepID=A0A9R0JP19_SPIOL|nr:uncharacterized protein LOC110782076 [Spinacia oleracea]XP_021841842.1 uncharacterized protein LOC110782076 [Spinacia oleracea]KNA13989.1 hypothetical protein SOVF_111480 [Spinacia oleracea]
MKATEAANNPAKQFEEAILSRKQYLDTARDHYLTALAGLSGGKQEQPKISPCSDSSLLLEDNVCNLAVEAEQASTTPGHGLEKTFSEMDVQMLYPNGVLKASEKDLEAVKLQFNKSLARNTKSQITEMICKLGILGKEIDTIDAADSKTTRTASIDPDNAMESLRKTVVESSSIHRMVESLKAKLDNLKKEHAGLSDVDVGAESAARNLNFRFFRSKPENEGCFAKKDKASQTSEEVTQDKEVNDLKIKARGLKREHDAAKFSKNVEKRPKIMPDVDEAKERIVSSADLVKSFPEGIHPACVSTSESSARFMISEDELESSSQQVGKSAKLDRGTSVAAKEGVEGEKCDYASEFSIRDFVFAARNRDISLNWPFSQKNLQLCLKHGVKNVLPSFQPLDSPRDSSMNCLAENILRSEESNVRLSMFNNHIAPDTILQLDHSWNQDLAEGYRDSDSFRTGGERDLVFKTVATANSQSEVGSVSTSNLPLSEVSDEREAVGSAANNKTNSSASQLSSKKCKVAVKIRVNSKRNTPEDITSPCTGPPETISSKICPVCETFSSSSNTTLNAHIDQCLSSQSPPIWMKSSKLIKPRIKPRKIRLMTDICATAPCCTLEDLDRRNGTNWAANADLPLEEADVPSERRCPGVSSRYLKQNADDGSVYIDSSGRKIRILSKFNSTSPSFSKAREDQRPKKQSRKAKRSKFFSPNRKRCLAKHLKYLKATRQRKRSFSSKTKGPSVEACGLQDAVREVGGEKQPASFVKRVQVQEQNHPGDPGGITKLSRCEVQATKDSLIGNDQVGNAEVGPRWTPVKKHIDLPKISVSFTQSNLTTPAISPVWVDRRSDGSCREKMLGGRSLRGAVRENRDALQVSLKSGATLSNRNIAVESTPNSSDSAVVPAPPLEREADIQPNVLPNAVISFSTSRGLLRSCRAGPSKGMRPRNPKAMISPNRSCARGCQSNSEKIGPALENSRDCHEDEEAEAWSTDTSEQFDATIDHPKSTRISDSLGRSNMVKVRQKRALEYGQNGDTNRDNELADDTRGCVSSAMTGLHNETEFIASVSSSSLAIGVNKTSLRTTFNPELEKVVDVSQSKLLQCSDKFQSPLFRAEASGNLSQPGLNDECEMLCGNLADSQRLELKTGDYILNFGHGGFSPEVDPMLIIPGPPGSDLPSFSDMGSEDDNYELGRRQEVDGDLSESPFSATSTISNLGRNRTDDVTVNEQKSFGVSLSVPDNVYPVWLGASCGPFPGISTVSSRITAPESERVTRVNSSANDVIDLQCCPQIEEITQSTMTSQESQLLGWRPTFSKSFSGGNHTYSALDGNSIVVNDRNAVLSSSNYHRENSVNSADPFSRTGDCDSISPSALTLRLMGKDLKVSNQIDTDLSRSQAAINGDMNKLVKRSWEPQSPTFLRPLPHVQDHPQFLPVRHFDVESSNVMHSFGSHNQSSGGMYLNERMHAGFSVLGAGPFRR